MPRGVPVGSRSGQDRGHHEIVGTFSGWARYISHLPWCCGWVQKLPTSLQVPWKSGRMGSEYQKWARGGLRVGGLSAQGVQGWATPAVGKGPGTEDGKGRSRGATGGCDGGGGWAGQGSDRGSDGVSDPGVGSRTDPGGVGSTIPGRLGSVGAGWVGCTGWLGWLSCDSCRGRSPGPG